MSLKDIAEKIIGEIHWLDDVNGLAIKCPGQHLHTTRSTKRDCKVYLNGAPTVFCFHSSCAPVLDRVNLDLRRAMNKNQHENIPLRQLSKEERLAIRKREVLHRFEENSHRIGRSIILASIQKKFSWPIEEVFEDSPLKPSENPEEDYALFLSRLFRQDDVIWIGDVTDSGEGCEKNFRLVSDWIKICPIGNFTTGSTFKPGVFNRSNENVLESRYMVIESDTLNKLEMLSIFKWMITFCRLRAIVDTGGKSLHGWFDHASERFRLKLKPLLHELGCDRSLFKPSQPVRLPGVKRGEKRQKLLWIDNQTDKS